METPLVGVHRDLVGQDGIDPEAGDPRFPAARPGWSDPELDAHGVQAAGCWWQSRPEPVLLSRHRGAWSTPADESEPEVLQPARLLTAVQQNVTAAEPVVTIARFADRGNRMLERDDALHLTPDEAEMLAGVLTALVGRVRGGPVVPG